MTEETTAESWPPEEAPRKRSVINRRTLVQTALGAAAVAGAAGLTAWSAERHAEDGDREAAALSRSIVAQRVSGPLARDPLAAAWTGIPALDVPLVQQFMVAPRLQPEGMIAKILLRTVHNGSEIGFHIGWQDGKADDFELVSHFQDAVAVQLPIDSSSMTVAAMGQPGRLVHILQWRASWQAAAAGKPHTMKDAFPNGVNDLSPEDVMKPEQARVYYPALNVGNPVAARERTTAVQELVAEGYGTLTAQEQQRAEGIGVHTSTGWEVVIVVPMAGGKNQARLAPGQKTMVALAVWDGSKNDRGARKQWANWTALELGA